MMKKKVFSVLFSLTVLASSVIGFAGCGGAGDGLEALPEYEDNKEMMIGGWDSPPNTLEDYQLAKDMGLTHIFIDEYFAPKGSQDYEEILGFCEEVGLKAIINMGASIDGEKPVDDTDYSVYPAVDMVNYWDEPTIGRLDIVREQAQEHEALYEGKRDITFYVNLDPNGGGGDPEEYMTKYCEEIVPLISGRKILSTDVYPLLGRNGAYSVSSTWLPRLELNATYAKQYGMEQHFFVQSYWSTLTGTRELESIEDLRFQFYVDMAYGVQNFSYFTYTHSFIEGFGGGCVDRENSCKTTEIYDWAKQINAELTAFDHVYLSFEWNGTMPIVGKDNPDGENAHFMALKSPLSSLTCANSVSSSQDSIIGQFKDADGNDGLIVTNYTDPLDKIDNIVSFDFKNANRAIIYRGGERKIYEVKDGKLDIRLSPGEGVFVIPVKLK